jgi:hypothetical protein
MALRDFLIAPRDGASRDQAEAAAGEAAGPGTADELDPVSGREPLGGGDAVRRRDASRLRRVAVRGRLRFAWGVRRPAAAGAPSLGVLANARDLAAVAVAAGVLAARGGPAALVCLHAPDIEPSTPPLRAPARAAADRLAASLRARGLAAEARGRVAVVELAREGDDAATAAARALAAAGALPTVLGVAVRDPDLDALLAAQDAILVALPPSADPALAELTATSAARLTANSAPIALALDPVSRALAVGGLRPPRALQPAIDHLLP